MFTKISVLLLSVAVALGGMGMIEAQAEMDFTVNISDDGVPVEGLQAVHIHFLDWEGNTEFGDDMEEVEPGVYQYTIEPWTSWIYWEVQIDDENIIPQVPSQNPCPDRHIYYQARSFNWEVQDNR